MNPASHPIPTHKLALNILIKDEQDGQVSATVLGLPEYRVLKSDRTSVISELERKLAHALSAGEVMALEIEIPQPEHPWQKFAGMYQDSELFESVLENIATHREHVLVTRNHRDFAQISDLTLEDWSVGFTDKPF